MKWLNVDLPNLTSINSIWGNSFQYPRSVTLESISEYWILIVFRYSKSSKCQSAWWLWSSIRGSSIEINFEYCLTDLISFIDISTTLYRIVPLSKNELQTFDTAVTSIIIPNWTSFRIGLVMILITQYLISRDLVLLNQLKLAMIVLNQWKHSKSMDWIDWKPSKSATIHLLRKRIYGEIINRNHFTYWIVNHWNPFKLVNIVSVILEVNLNWRIYHNYIPFKSVQLEVIHTISVIVHLWFEVLNWYWICEWLDLPNLQSITLGDYAFEECLSTIIESIEWIWMKWFE